MTALFIFVCIATLVLLFRPTPRTRVIYVPVEITEEHSDLGCLPMIVFAAGLAIALSIISL